MSPLWGAFSIKRERKMSKQYKLKVAGTSKAKDIEFEASSIMEAKKKMREVARKNSGKDVSLLERVKIINDWSDPLSVLRMVI